MILTSDMKVRMIRDPLGASVRVVGWDLELSEMLGFRFFIDERVEGIFGLTWSITELTSGARVVAGVSRLDAIDRAEALLFKIGRGRFAKRVAEVIEKFEPLNLEELENDDGR